MVRRTHCPRPINRLLMMRKSGLMGPMFQQVAPGVCARSTGAFHDVGGGGHPGTTIPSPYFCIDFSNASLSIPAIRNPTMLLDFSMGTLVPCKDATGPDVEVTVEITGIPFADMDADGNPDILIATDPPTFVTIDADSVNIDTDGDHVADVVIDR